MKLESFIKEIDQLTKLGIPIGFTGLGIILVSGSVERLPISSLLSENCAYSNNNNEKDIVNFLFSLSNIVDNRHDGFHVVSLKTGELKISQYFSPMISLDSNKTVFDVGARYRSAQYGSLDENIDSIIVINQNGSISIARKGFVELIKK